jgi:hypothetical protein
MAFQPAFSASERVETKIDLVISNKPSLFLLLTNEAVYWPGRKKGLAISDPVTTERLAIAQVRAVHIFNKSTVGSLLTGILMILGGVVWTFGGYVGAPQALIVGGIIVALIGRRRRVLRLEGTTQELKWSEPITFGQSVKREVTNTLETVKLWANRHGVSVQA